MNGRIIEVMKEELQLYLSSCNAAEFPQHIRIALPYAPTKPLEWLYAQTSTARYYMADRKDTRVMAACGIADEYRTDDLTSFHDFLMGPEQLLHASSSELRYFGGFHFSPDAATAPCWKPFGKALFRAPRFELHATSDGCLLIMNVILKEHQDLEILQSSLIEEIEALQPPRSIPNATYHLAARTDSPDARGWQKNIEQALCAIRNGELEKIVLARETCLQLAETVEPVQLFSQLNDLSPGTYHFLFQIDEDHSFVGATPEMLFHHKDTLLESHAIAATRPRGATKDEDAVLAEELINSDKERREHQFVTRMLQEALGPICSKVLTDEVSVLKLPRLQHLFQTLHGKLHDNVDDATILKTLHPTPAVGGVPRPAALRCLQELEPFDRGWYAAPFGWLGNRGSGFAVAIRSALISGKSLRVYAGAGIVDGSDAQAELDEIENKISTYLKLVGASFHE